LPSAEGAEDRLLRRALALAAQAFQLDCELRRHRLAARLAALATRDQQRRVLPVEIQVPPAQSD
jgi:hypothetical protein